MQPRSAGVGWLLEVGRWEMCLRREMQLEAGEVAAASASSRFGRSGRMVCQPLRNSIQSPPAKASTPFHRMPEARRRF